MSGKVRRVGSREFADRLAPLWRWLGRHVGRGWSNVYHEFCERFDRRTMKGWHLREHLFGLVEPGRFPLLSGPFFVDRRGILRRRPTRRWPRRSVVSPTEEAKALAWASRRQVIVRGEVLYWTVRSIDALAPTSAQGRRLAPDESAFWSSLAAELREKLTYDAVAIRARLATKNTLRSRAR